MDGITISASVVSAIAGAVAAYFARKTPQKTKIEPNPLPVETTARKPFVTVGEFNRKCEACERIHSSIFLRLSAAEQGVAATDAKLDLIINDLGLIKKAILEK